MARQPTAWGYARASTIDQEETLTVQQEGTRREWEYRWKHKGFLWGGCDTDSGVSGDIPLRQRPNGMRLMAKLEPGDVVIFTKLDRGFRNVVDLLQCVEWFKLRGITAVILDCAADTSTAAGMMFITILGAFAAFERTRTSERMLEIWARRKKIGRPCSGKAPYGFKIAGPKGGRYYVTDEYTRKVGSMIVGWFDRGWSADAVYIHMIEQRIKTRGNKEWSRGAIQRAYVGEVRLRRQEDKIARKTGLTPDSPESSVTPGQSASGGGGHEDTA